MTPTNSDEKTNNLETGSVVKGRYKIISRLGEGASSVVYAAEDRDLGYLHVALKVFHPSFVRSPVFKKVYATELQSSYIVDHENVVRLYDMIKTGQMVALVTELVEGMTLDEYIQKFGGKIPDSNARAILLQVCKGLEAIHQKKIIHRDIKPQNILISKTGTVKISDFGVATEGNRDNSGEAKVQPKDNKNNILGTPYYVSPEYLTNGIFDMRGDLYALGIVFFEALAGVQLFDYSSMAKFLETKVDRAIPPLLSFVPSCNPEMTALIDKLVRSDPARRYQNAADVRFALERINLRTSGILNFPGDAKKIQKKPALRMKKLLKKPRGIIRSTLYSLWLLPQIIITAPFRLIRLAFGSSIIAYIVAAGIVYFVVTQTNLIIVLNSWVFG